MGEKQVPESAFARNKHQMEPSDSARAFRQQLDEQPRVAFQGLTAGKVYFDNDRHGGQSVFKVLSVTPSGAQAVVEFIVEQHQTKIYKGPYGNSARFVELDDDLLSYLGVTHEDIVREAVRRGLDVPPRVRRHYPLLFLSIPERFADRKLSEDLLRICHKFQPPGPLDIDRWIENANDDLAGLAHERAKRLGLNPDMSADFTRWIKEREDNIDYYRWLRSLVAEGGPFHIPDLEAPPEEKLKPVFPKQNRPRLPLPDDDHASQLTA